MKKQKKKHRNNPAPNTSRPAQAAAKPDEVAASASMGAGGQYSEARAVLAEQLTLICAAAFPGQEHKVVEPILHSLDAMIDCAIENRTGAC